MCMGNGNRRGSGTHWQPLHGEAGPLQCVRDHQVCAARGELVIASNAGRESLLGGEGG